MINDLTYTEVWSRLKNRIISKPDTLGCTSWKKYTKVAEATKDIDFGCDFEHGLCKKQRNVPPYYSGDDEFKYGTMGCCVRCNSSLGYLDHIQPGTIMKYLRMFNLKTGFWRHGEGCILPRSMRSYTCLTYSCSDKSSDIYVQISNLAKGTA